MNYTFNSITKRYYSGIFSTFKPIERYNKIIMKGDVMNSIHDCDPDLF